LAPEQRGIGVDRAGCAVLTLHLQIVSQEVTQAERPGGH
jgi:hypothetical protein